jgi:glycosyltransferase involved in cell wall biosynthesis
MTGDPKVSVLMPAYNAEKYIAEAIESILNQTFKDFELLICDDASIDSTPAIIEEYAKRDGRIRIFHNVKKLFVAGNTNLAIDNSRAELLARMDADDIALPERLEKQYAFMVSHPDTAVVGSWIQIMEEGGRGIGIREYLPDDEGLKRKIFRYSPFAHPSVMCRKKVIQEFGRYSETSFPAEDINLWFRIGTKYKFANLQEVLLRYRFFEKSTSNRKLLLVEKRTLKSRWYAWRTQGYKPNFVDFIYNIGQVLTMYLMPVKWRIRLFEIIRKHL